MMSIEEEASTAVAKAAIEIVQDCRKTLALQKGQLLTEAVVALADDRERLLARVEDLERRLRTLSGEAK